MCAGRELLAKPPELLLAVPFKDTQRITFLEAKLVFTFSIVIVGGVNLQLVRMIGS